MNEMVQMNKARDLLALWVHKINLSSAIDFYDINKVSENLCANLLNEIYGYLLINLNPEKRNFPAVDLGCDVKKIAFQITATKEADKVKEKIESTLEKFVNHNLQSRFTDGVRFLFLTTDKLVKLTDANKKKYQGIYSGFDEKHLLTLQDLTQEIQVLYNKDNERFCRVLKILERELSLQPNNYGIPLEQLIELAKKLGVTEKERDEWIRKYQDLEKTITSRTDDTAKQAKVFLDAGGLEQAEKLFKQSLTSKLAIVKEAAAEAFALAQIKDLQYETQEAIAYYQQSLQLNPDNVEGWNRLGLLFQRVGELDQAIAAYQTVLKLGKTHQNNYEIAPAYGNLGLVYKTRGELDKAVEMYNKVLEIDQVLGRKEGMAPSYGNLGIVYGIRGKLDKAAEMFNKALEIDQALGRKEGMALSYGNLGNVYGIRGKLDKAAEMFNKALEINQALGVKSAMADNYRNLGIVYKTRGEFDKAVEMYQKSLAIDEQMGNKEGMAADYGNLGNVYYTRGELDKAVGMYQKSLTLFEGLGSKQGIAEQYDNFASLYKAKGNKVEAKRYWQQSLELFKQLGSQRRIKEVQKALDDLK